MTLRTEVLGQTGHDTTGSVFMMLRTQVLGQTGHEYDRQLVTMVALSLLVSISYFVSQLRRN